ncbi:hypothetical protein GCM10022234_29220 [Aeromicrobium panaciterrae]|uniref:hypothetical protein n=1 Tax=Aeromicrobium panaciterrae TaxID=363861 RepID=UPI0031D6C96C
MPSRDRSTSPREIRNFAALQLGLTGAFLVALFWICGGRDADYPPTWLAIALVLPLFLAAFFAERVWLSGKPLSPDADAFQVQADALDAFTSQTLRKMLYVEAAMLPAVIVAFVGSYGAWPIVIVGFPGILLLAWEIWPTLRNVARAAVMLESKGTTSGLVDGFNAL